MRQNPSFAMTDVAELRRIIANNPWATIVSAAEDGLVASHYAVMLDDTRDDLTIVAHVGRPDDMLHDLGNRELMVIFQGPHGYITPRWYPPETPNVPTWNFVAVHLSGVPEVLTAEENLVVLDKLVAHFENLGEDPRLMWERPNTPEYVERLEKGTVGFRLTPTKVTAKRKLSQNRPAEVVDVILAGLEQPGPYRNGPLAREMRRAHEAMREAQA